VPTTSSTSGNTAAPFDGFESLSSNYIYCPNQFFDVCLPHCSRGTVRLVSYVLFETLRLRDENGNPIQQDISVSYRDLIEKGGISRGAIRKASDEAIKRNVVTCVTPARRKAKGQSPQTARLMLQWDYNSPYHRSHRDFQGFYAGEGNRSPIPEAFFEQVVPFEPFSVIKIVGAVMRHTIGYENQFGRRPQAPLSFSFLQRYTNIRNRTDLSTALKRAIEANYIMCQEEGCFSPDSVTQKSATYAVKWLGDAKNNDIGSKNVPGTQNTQDQFKKRTSNGSKNVPEDQFKKRTTRKSVYKDTTQQQTVGESAAVGLVKVLQKQGFNARDAEQIAAGQSPEQVAQQIRWLEHRQPSRNKLGMLRRAIEENWDEPIGLLDEVKNEQRQECERKAQLARNERGELAAQQKQEREKQRQVLLIRWQALSASEQKNACHRRIMQAKSDAHRRRLHNINLENPPLDMLLALETEVSQSH